MNVLFVCNQGQNRSRTAAEMFSSVWDTDFAGIYGNEITEAQFSKADVVIVMEEHQRKTLSESFPDLYLKKKILSLDIPDVYSFQQPALRLLLEERIRPLMELR